MANFHYTLGLDIGIASVGWAVLRNNLDGEPDRIDDLGVRVFEKAENEKDGSSLALPRREARGTRRRLRRHRHRLERIRYLLEQCGVMSMEEIEKLYQQPGGFRISPYQLRAEALDRPLSKEEAVRVLIHLAQRRGYCSNSTSEAAKDAKETGKVKTAIQENRDCMKENGYRTIGEMMFRDLRFWMVNMDGTLVHRTHNSPGHYDFTVERSAIREEIQQIFAAQRQMGVEWMSETLETAYTDIFSGQRNYDEGPGMGNIKGVQTENPFTVRPEERIGNCTVFKKDEKRAAKATYSFEYFRLLQSLNNMRIVDPDTKSYPLSDEQRQLLKEAALQSPSLTYEQLRKKLNLKDREYFRDLFYGNQTREEAERRKKWSQMQSYHKLKKALSKDFQSLTVEQIDQIQSILTLYRSDDQRKQALREASIPEALDNALMQLSFSGYGHLSLKALHRLIPLLEEGKRYDEAFAEAFGAEGQEERLNGIRKSRLSMNDLEEEITNPVVKRAISQTIKVINAVVRKNGPPDVVRIELAREMGKSYAERGKIEKRQDKNRKKNEEAKKTIQEYRSQPTGQDIVKYKLWQQQDGICLYSGRKLELAHLFEHGYAEVDHIIPYSQCFDDSYQNKVLVLAEENQQKGNRLPYEYFGQDPVRWQAFEARVERVYDYKKRQRLLKKEWTEEESNEFKERNLKDTQYITTRMFHLLREHMLFADSRYSRNPVVPVNGNITSQLRKCWGLDKDRGNGDLHHSMDAVVIATATPGLIQRLTTYYQVRETWKKTSEGYVNPKTGEIRKIEIPKPWLRFREELEARLSENPQEEIDRLKLGTYEHSEEIPPIFVSRMPRHKVTGPAHEATIRSTKGVREEGCVISRKPLTELKLDDSGEIKDYYAKSSDRLLYDALKKQLAACDNDAKRAFAEPFYKPKRDGTPGPRVDKVKIVEKKAVLKVGDGVAENGDMVRIDVFYVEDEGYYFVPIYIADTRTAELPMKAAVAFKAWKDWKEMRDEDFLFSLHKGDLIRVRNPKGVKLTLDKKAKGEANITREDGLYYFKGANRAIASIEITTHDRRYIGQNMGIKTLPKGAIEKYQVDVLGEYHRVSVPEKRMRFTGGR